MSKINLQDTNANAIYAFYKGRGKGIGTLSEDHFKEIADLIDDGYKAYLEGNEKEGSSDENAAEHYLGQLEELFGYEVEYEDELAYNENIIWMMNINWLEKKGYLKVDDNNGMLYVQLEKK